MSLLIPTFNRPLWLHPKVARTEILAGLVVAIALIPEAISFSILAGVDPRVGLFASFTMAVTIAFTGGRPAMISAATGAIALVVAPLAREYGLEYLIAAVILGGIFQVLLAFAGVARLMRFVPRSVMVGFVNADSYGKELQPAFGGLGLLPYGNGVHYDSEKQRRPLVHELVANGSLPTTYATDDRIGILYSDTIPIEVVSDFPDSDPNDSEGAAAYRIELVEGVVVETRLPVGRIN